jgi:hypothetical protein
MIRDIAVFDNPKISGVRNQSKRKDRFHNEVQYTLQYIVNIRRFCVTDSLVQTTTTATRHQNDLPSILSTTIIETTTNNTKYKSIKQTRTKQIKT